MKTLTALLLVIVSSASFAANPNIALTWAGDPATGNFWRITCGGTDHDNVIAPFQLTDASGNYVNCGTGQSGTLRECNLIEGCNTANGQVVFAVPSGTAPILTVITNP